MYLYIQLHMYVAYVYSVFSIYFSLGVTFICKTRFGWKLCRCHKQKHITHIWHLPLHITAAIVVATLLRRWPLCDPLNKVCKQKQSKNLQAGTQPLRFLFICMYVWLCLLWLFCCYCCTILLFFLFIFIYFYYYCTFYWLCSGNSSLFAGVTAHLSLFCSM